MSRMGLLLCALLVAQAGTDRLTLEIRVFSGTEEVSAETRVTVHRAGERGQPVGQVVATEPKNVIAVPPGIYDAQAVRERAGRVLNIRWAERLVVMPYPDEGGHHLEVINFAPGYGALQVRTPSAGPPATLALFRAGVPGTPFGSVPGDGYTLYVVPAGEYDLEVTRGGRKHRTAGIEVPLDRTRLWVVP